MRRVEARRVGHHGLRNAAHVLDRGDPRPRRGPRVHQAEVRTHPDVEGPDLVHDRHQQAAIDPGVQLEEVHALAHQAVHGLPRLGRRVHLDGVGIGGRRAVDHRPRGVHPGADARAAVELVAQGECTLERTMRIAHGGDAPREVPRDGPAEHAGLGIDEMHVAVDQPRDDPVAAHIHAGRAGGRVKPSALPTDSIRAPRTTTTALGSGGPPEPSISVAPTRAKPSGERATHATNRPSASAASEPKVRESIHGREEVLEGGCAPQAMQAARAPHVYLCR